MYVIKIFLSKFKRYVDLLILFDFRSNLFRKNEYVQSIIFYVSAYERILIAELSHNLLRQSSNNRATTSVRVCRAAGTS